MHKVSAQLLYKTQWWLRSATKQLLAGQRWDWFFLIQGEKMREGWYNTFKSLFFSGTEYDKGSDCNVWSFCVCYHGVPPGAATPGDTSISDAAFCLSTRFLGRVDELFSCSRSDFYCRFQWFSKITLMMKNNRSAVKIAALLVKASKKASSNCMTLYFLSSRTDRGSIVLRKNTHNIYCSTSSDSIQCKLSTKFDHKFFDVFF